MPGGEHQQQHGRAARAVAPLVAFAALALPACDGATEPAADAAPAVTSAPTRTIAPTTTPSTTTTTSTTTIAATTTTTTSTTVVAPSTSTTVVAPSTSTTTSTTVVQETQPIAPPADAHAAEPVIEVGSIRIPTLDVDMPMYEGIRLTTLDYGPGHWPGTALPGQVGNVVVAGHRTSKHQVFRNVDELEPGDEIIFRDDLGEHVYLVDRVEIVEPTAMWIVDPTDTATATLFACHPPGSTAQRIVVFADLAA